MEVPNKGLSEMRGKRRNQEERKEMSDNILIMYIALESILLLVQKTNRFNNV